jgi:hypothetical protein
MTLLDHVRDYLAAEGLVRAPEDAGAMPPAWRMPQGAVGPGDAKQQKKAPVTWDNGLVVSLMFAPGIPPEAGAEERRIDGLDIWYRTQAVQPAVDLDVEIRRRFLGVPPDPGGRSDWVMAGLYVIQSRLWSTFQPVSADGGVYSFKTGWLFETRAT